MLAFAFLAFDLLAFAVFAFALFALAKWQSATTTNRIKLYYLTAVEVDVGAELEVVEELKVVDKLVVVEALDGAVDVGAELDVVGELVVAALVADVVELEAEELVPVVGVLLKNIKFQLKISFSDYIFISLKQLG